MKWFLRVVRTYMTVLLVVSLLGNIALGVLNFVLQPLWRASAVATAVAATRARAEIEERRAVARARLREKAKARVMRVAAILPFVGIATVVAFEGADYHDWKEENPEGDPATYAREVMSISKEVAAELFPDMPDDLYVRVMARMETLVASVAKNADADEGSR